MKKMLKTLFTCVVGATSLMLLNQTEAGALKYESTIQSNGFLQRRVIVEGTDTDGDGFLTDLEANRFEILYSFTGLSFGYATFILSDVPEFSFSLDLSVPPTGGALRVDSPVLEVQSSDSLVGLDTLAVGGDVALITSLTVDTSLRFSNLIFSEVFHPTTGQPGGGGAPGGENTASTPEPSLSLLGFITLGGFMLGSRKKEKA